SRRRGKSGRGASSPSSSDAPPRARVSHPFGLAPPRPFGESRRRRVDAARGLTYAVSASPFACGLAGPQLRVLPQLEEATMGGKAGRAPARGRAGKRRQWGSDRRTALPAVPAVRTERLLSATRIAIFVTVVGWVAFVATTLSKAFFGDTFSIRYAADAVIYLVVVTLLTGSAPPDPPPRRRLAAPAPRPAPPPRPRA